MVENANRAENTTASFGPKAVASVITSTIRDYLAFDAPLIVLLIVFAALVLPFVPTATRSAQELVYSGRLDEPGMTMCLDSMTVFPYGNSANYWNDPGKRPPLWQYWNYTFWVYCTGAYFDLPFVVYAPLKWLGMPVFPAAPLILRLASFAAGFAFLVVIYNFAKCHSGFLAGAFALVILMTNGEFMLKSASVAPDTLLLLLSVLALVIAQRHAEAGDWTSLAALGLVAGWQHSTKFAGPYVAPVGLLAAYWGWQQASGPQTQRRYSDLFYRVVVLGAFAVIGLLMAIPYAAVDLAYWRSILMAPEPIKQASFSSYMTAIQAQEGWALVVVALLAIAALLWRRSRDVHNRALVLAVVLAVSNILFWPLFYLEKTRLDTMVLGFGLLAVVSGDFLSKFVRPSQWSGWRKAIGVFAVCAIGVWLISSRWYPMAVRLSNAVGEGAQAVAHATRAVEGVVPEDAHILFDTAAVVLFDTGKYPNQSSSGTLRYPDLWRLKPDYFMLNQFMFGTEKYQQLARTQQESIFSTYLYSVRLYQDLFVKWGNPNDVGPTNVPGVEIVARVPSFRRVTSADELLFRGSWIERHLPNVVAQVNALRSRLRDGTTDWSPETYEDIPGPGIVIYKLHPVGGPNGRSSPISGGDEGGDGAFRAFDQNNSTVWFSGQSGADVKQESFLGFDYGGGTTIKVPSVGITWVDVAHTPSHLVIQYSDDGAVWTDVMQVTPRIPANGGPGWDETFSLPDVGAHRAWRILANAVLASGATMGIAELRLPDPSW